jgi:DNA-binding CsgD family transcriptional regulator
MNRYLERQKKQQKERDDEVLAMLAQGVTKSEIARRLGVSRQRSEQLINRIKAGRNDQQMA